MNQTRMEDLPSNIIDDLTARILIYVIYTTLCQIMNIFGIVTNIINIVCFVSQGFKDTITVSLLGLSVSDLASLITMVWTCISFTPGFVAADLPFDSISVAYLVSAIPHSAFTRVSSSITAVIALERCLSIVVPLQVKNVFTPMRIGVITTSIFLIFTLSATPSFVVNRLGSTFSYVKNKSIITMMSTNQREEVEKATFLINNLFIPYSAFLIVAISTIMLSTQLFNKAKWRQTATSEGMIDRISGRNLKVAKLVVAISALFIVCMLPNSILMLAIAFLPELWVNGKYMNLSMIIGGLTHFLESINSSVNICIYYHMSTKYRDTFRGFFMRGKIYAS